MHCNLQYLKLLIIVTDYRYLPGDFFYVDTKFIDLLPSLFLQSYEILQVLVKSKDKVQIIQASFSRSRSLKEIGRMHLKIPKQLKEAVEKQDKEK